MIIEGSCRECDMQFDAHWSKVAKEKSIDYILKPWCPQCGSKNVHVTTDEYNDREVEYDNDND